MSNEFMIEFTRVLKKAEKIKEKFGVDFALGWYLGKMITPKMEAMKQNE